MSDKRNNAKQTIELSDHLTRRIADRLLKRYCHNGIIVLAPNGAWRDVVASEIRASLNEDAIRA